MKKKLLLSFLLLVLLTSCHLPGLGANTSKDIVIASGSTSERQILAQMIVQMIEHDTDLNTDIINNLGSTTLITIAMENGDINASGAMYTGTSLTGELEQPPQTDSKKALRLVQDGYQKKYDWKWYDSYGFANTYAFMVKREFAEKYQLKKVSDLEKIKNEITVGVDTGWTDRPGDGYEAFQKKYGFSFSNFYPMQIGLVYSAISSGNMDVVLGYSTDGRVQSYDLVLLEDDKQLFPAYDCSPCISNELLRQHPEVDTAISKLCGKIDTETMQKLNRQADEEMIEPAIVAKRFLEEHRYFEED